MLFSERYKIPNADNHEWLDPLLTVDTALFVDPFLVYGEKSGDFAGSHQQVIDYFNSLFVLAAEGAAKMGSPQYHVVRDLCRFPEVAEACIGLSQSGTSGRGSGGVLAGLIAEAIHRAILAGLTHVEHFEEIGIIQPGFGPDRISDITLFLLRDRFAKYTAAKCAELGVETREFDYEALNFDGEARTWLPGKCRLPVNPYTDGGVLLIPKRFLRRVPTIRFDDFYEYCVNNESDVLRNQFNIDVSKRVKKKEILDIARKNIAIVQRYIKIREMSGSSSYDLQADVNQLRSWYFFARDHGASRAVARDESDPDWLWKFAHQLGLDFKSFVEQHGGHTLLWNDNGSHKTEKAAQKVFQAVAGAQCRASFVEMSPETNIGRGPVDFKFSGGKGLRALLEVKLIKSSAWWKGWEKQLPVYMQAENAEHGIYVGVAFRENELDRSRALEAAAKELAASDSKLRVSYLGVSAIPPLSASRVA